MKIFVFISILALMGTQSVFGKEHSETGGAESKKQLIHNINTSDYSLKTNESLKKPIAKWRYITGGVLATSAPIFSLASIVSLLKYAGHDVHVAVPLGFLLATISGSFGIPRAVQGRYWPTGFVFTTIQGASIIALLGICEYVRYDYCDTTLSLSTLPLALAFVGFLGSAIWQAADAWILSDSYELAEKSSWGITPTYSYNKDTGSNAYGLALQYMW